MVPRQTDPTTERHEQTLLRLEEDMYWQTEDETECHVKESGVCMLPPDMCMQCGVRVGPSMDGKRV